MHLKDLVVDGLRAEQTGVRIVELLLGYLHIFL